MTIEWADWTDGLAYARTAPGTDEAGSSPGVGVVASRRCSPPKKSGTRSPVRSRDVQGDLPVASRLSGDATSCLSYLVIPRRFGGQVPTVTRRAQVSAALTPSAVQPVFLCLRAQAADLHQRRLGIVALPVARFTGLFAHRPAVAPRRTLTSDPVRHIAPVCAGHRPLMATHASNDRRRHLVVRLNTSRSPALLLIQPRSAEISCSLPIRDAANRTNTAVCGSKRMTPRRKVPHSHVR